MKKLSLRLRLLMLFCGISSLMWAVSGVVVWFEGREKINEFFDQYQMLMARQLAVVDWNRVRAETQEITNRIISRIKNADEEDEAIAFAIFSDKGKKIFHDNENGKDFAFAPQLESFVTQRVDDEDWRIVWINSADGRFIIAVGQELEYRQDIIWDMAEEFLLPWLIGLLFLLAAIIYFIGREFAPLRRLASELALRKADDLTPLAPADLPTEVQPLLQSVNRLLEKLNILLQKEKSFVANSAHELRSPLTALKVQLEVLQLSDNDAAARKSVVDKLEAGINRCTRLVEQLLQVSRLDNAQPTKFEALDWAKITSELLAIYAPSAASKNQQIQLQTEDTPFLTCGNGMLIAVMLRNLLDNAVKYGSENSVIAVVVDGEKLEVCNVGNFVDENCLSRMGERFFRPSGQKENGSGLGLSIVMQIAALHGCAVQMFNSPRGFSVRITTDESAKK